MLHIALNLTQTGLADLYRQLTATIDGLVKPEYLHVSLVILKAKNFLERETHEIHRIASRAALKISGLKEFTVLGYHSDQNGYLMLDLKIEGLEPIILEMEQALEALEFDIIKKRPFHSTIVKGVFGTDAEVNAAMVKMQKLASIGSLKAALIGRTFPLDGAVFAEVHYPNQGMHAGKVQNSHAFFEFRNIKMFDISEVQPDDCSEEFCATYC